MLNIRTWLGITNKREEFVPTLEKLKVIPQYRKEIDNEGVPFVVEVCPNGLVRIGNHLWLYPEGVTQLINALSGILTRAEFDEFIQKQQETK